MYEKFYGLNESPFNLTPDSRFLYLSTHHREALAALVYGVRERKGFTLLTGEIGSGKTTLCRALIKDLEEQGVKSALILDSYVTESELLQAVNEDLGIDTPAATRKGHVDALHRYLIEENEAGRNVAIIIDEAQNLRDSTLEQVRLLGNLETETTKLLQIVLIGQPELQTTLQQTKHEQLNQRIAVRYHLRALDLDEIDPYIQHRLRVAGAAGPIEFTDTAIELIFEYTGGVPRKINLLCDRALLAGYVASSRTIDEPIIRSAAMEVGADQWVKTAEAHEGGPRSGWPKSTTVLTALLVLVILAMVPVVLSETGLLRTWMGAPHVDRIEADEPDNPSGPIQALPPAPTQAPAPMETPAPTPTEPTPAPEFRLAQPPLADPWTYDRDQVVRVDQPEYARTAAVLSLLAAWGIEVNLQDFRSLKPQDAETFDVVEANRDIGLRRVEIKGGLDRAINYNVPHVVEIDDPQKRLSRYVTLLKMDGADCLVADPMMGRQRVPRSLLESIWKNAWVIYFDPDNLGNLVKGEQSETVSNLQEQLADLGFYNGAPTGEFDRATVNAVEYLQRYFELFPTGKLDPVTVMLITTHSQPDRPRLVPEEEPIR